MTPINIFALVWCHVSVFPRQGPSESDFGISIKCAISMFDGIFFLKTSVFTAQGPSESDFGISIRCALFLLNQHVR